MAGAHLHLNVMLGDLKQVKFYVEESRENVNKLFQDIWTPLDLAIFYNYPAIIDFLKKHGGKTNTVRDVSSGLSGEASPQAFPTAPAMPRTKSYDNHQTHTHASTSDKVQITTSPVMHK